MSQWIFIIDEFDKPRRMKLKSIDYCNIRLHNSLLELADPDAIAAVDIIGSWENNRDIHELQITLGKKVNESNVIKVLNHETLHMILQNCVDHIANMFFDYIRDDLDEL